MEHDGEFKNDVSTLRFQFDHEDLEAKQDLMDRIAQLLENIPDHYKVDGENTTVTLRIFTRRC